MTGYPGDGPMKTGQTWIDHYGGLQGTGALIAALLHRARTGEGQYVEVSMQEAATMFMRTMGLQSWGEEPAPRRGIHHGTGATSTYPCKGGGPNDWVFIMPTTTVMWDTLCAAIDRTDMLTDPRYATEEAREQHVEELCEEISRWSRERTKHEAMRELGEFGVPASAVLDTRDLFDDPHLTARDFIQEVEHPQAGTLRLMRWPPRMSASEVPIIAAPLLGQHTDEVLHDVLGLTEGELPELRDVGAIA